MKKTIIVMFLIFIIVITACNKSVQPSDGLKMTVFKSPNCGCCSGWSQYAQKNGFNVDTINNNNMDTIKTQYNIPKHLESCHTTLVDEYFIEGHIPIEAVNKLLDEKPDIDGIAMPAMPSGSPGMPGPKQGAWTVYAVKDGDVSEFMKI